MKKTAKIALLLAFLLTEPVLANSSVGQLIKSGSSGTEAFDCGRDIYCRLSNGDAAKLCANLNGRLPSLIEFVQALNIGQLPTKYPHLSASDTPVWQEIREMATKAFRPIYNESEETASVAFYIDRTLTTGNGYRHPLDEIWTSSVASSEFKYTINPKSDYFSATDRSYERHLVACAFDSPNPQSQSLLVQLFDAIEAKDLAGVSALLAKGVNPNRNVYRRSIKMIEDNVLNPPGPSVNQSDFTAYGALTYTIWKGNLEVLDLLLKHPGIDLENRTSCDNFSVPLLQAILKKDLKSAELLLKRGANVNANDCRMCTYPISALSMAAGGGGIQRFVSEPNLEMVKLLLRYGPKVGDLEVLAACGSYFDHKPNPEVCATVRGAKP